MKARTLFVTAWLVMAFVATGCSDKSARPAASSPRGRETAKAELPQPIPAHVDDHPNSPEPSPAEPPPAETPPAETPPAEAPLESPPSVVPREEPGSTFAPPASDSAEPNFATPNTAAPPVVAPPTETLPSDAPVSEAPVSEARQPEAPPPGAQGGESGNPLRGSVVAPAAPRPRLAFGGNPLRSARGNFASRPPTPSPASSPSLAAPAAPPRIPASSTPSRIPAEPQDSLNVPLPAAPKGQDPSGGAAPPADFNPSAPRGGFMPPLPMPPPLPSESPEPQALAPAEPQALAPTEPPALEPPSDVAEAAPREFTPDEETASPMPRDMSPAARQPQLGPGDAASPPPPTGGLDDDDVASTAPGESPESMGLLSGSHGSSDAGSSAAAGVQTPDPFTIVKVFYGTDRVPIAIGAASPGMRYFAWLPLFITLTLIVALAASAFVYRKSHRTWAGIATAVVVVAICAAVARPFSLRNAFSGSATAGPIAYGNGRGELDFGEIEVTIPKTHKVGEVERPSILRLELQERSDKHVVIRRIDRMEQTNFFESVKARVSESPREDLFVFIHGYNVSFEMAARRTAQMAHDLQFEGAPIFYSWPSQGGLLQYPVDENNVAWTVPHLKQFLRDVIDRTDAKAVNIIAHSMGNRALAAAVRELALEKSISEKQFNQVVLAAPDIDAEVFKRDIAPVLTQTAQHVTLYASSRDQALVASKLVHGYPRAGDSGSNLLVVPGVETIDVSDVDTGILGHSYYGNSMPILRDLNLILRASQAAAGRPWLEHAQHDGLGYWVFEPQSLANRESGARR